MEYGFTFTPSVEGAKEKDESAFEFLYNKSYGILKRETLKYVSNDYDADDNMMILAQGQYYDLDDRKTRLNNNVLVVGDNVIIGLSPSDFRKRGSHGGLVHICLRRQ